MHPDKVKTAADARKFAAAYPQIKLGLFDMDGVMRGKYVARDKFLSALAGGFGFCDVVLGWDMHDQLYDNAAYTGWHTAYPDALARILPATCRAIPDEPDAPLFLAEFAAAAESICPRALLRRVLNRAAAAGFSVKAACEFEFFLFEENPHSAREKEYQNLKTITPGFFGYSVLRSSVNAEFYRGLLDYCRKMRMPLEGLHTESGGGVIEAALSATDAMEAADRAALFKTFAKVFAQRRGMMATFMARWSLNWPGQSGHIHISLADKNGANVFYNPKKPDELSPLMRRFIGGQQKLMPEFLAMAAPTVNSFTRLVPGFWAPTAATWGIDNRTCALRAILGGKKSRRVEYRIAAADINPYIAMAAAIGSGLWGIEHSIEPDAPLAGNAYAKNLPKNRKLPATLGEAANRLASSAPARDLFGAPFVEHYAASREWEEREFRKCVTDWELRRYFEII